MTDRVYVLLKGRSHDLTVNGKFYSSPYNAVLHGELLRRTLPDPDAHYYKPVPLVLDIRDIPCDHTVIRDFVTGFVNSVHQDSYAHGYALIERDVCEYDLMFRGEWVCTVMILYIPPSTDPADESVGESFLRVLTAINDESKEAFTGFRLLFDAFSDRSW